MIKHALIIVFEYHLNRVPLDTEDPPGPLLSMFIDLCLMYELAIKKFQIPEKNITIITDIRPPKNQTYPWKMRRNNNNINLIRLNYPDIELITRSIAQFIENTIRGIEDLPISKGFHPKHEIFFYASGHGALIPSSLDIYGCIDDEDTALLFLRRHGDTLKRAYLRRQDIFSILFGHIKVEDDGTMIIPYTKRIETKDRRLRIKTHNYIDAVFDIKLTPISKVDDRSTRLSYATNDRGLPLNTSMLTIIDSCHSASMTDFHFVYSEGRMIPTNKIPIKHPFPVCISIAAAEDTSDAPSTSNGSPFTRTIFNIFSAAEYSETIKTFHATLYEQIPAILQSCKPTITATVSNADHQIPFLSHLPMRSDSPKTPEVSLLSHRVSEILRSRYLLPKL